MLKIAAALALAMGAVTAPALAVPTMAAHTNVVVFDAQSMRVTARQTGYCWTTSIASRRSDAYRCMAGNSIHDPCFKLTGNSVACPTGEDARSGVVMALTKPLPQESAPANAWRMQLTNGVSCNVATGTAIPGYPYYCSGGLVCSAPPPGQPQHAVFVKCAQAPGGKPQAPGSYLVTILYE